MGKNCLEVDIAIIGGGAAGLAAAVCSAKKLKNGRVVVVEKERTVGRKLLATGNGRCNLSNENLSVEYYNGSCKGLAGEVIGKYSTDKIRTFFSSIGLMCRVDNVGRVYPYCEKASAVLDLLRLNMNRYGVTELCNTEVLEIKSNSGKLLLKTNNTDISAKRVILSTGGKASPKLGSDGASYQLAKMLGLESSVVFPSLVPVRVDCDFLPYLKGIRTSVEVSLVADGQVIRKEIGELQLTQNSLSGICMFQLSRYVGEFFALKSIYGKKYRKIEICVDLMPDVSYGDLESLLFRRRKQMSFLPLEEFFNGLFNKKIGHCLMKELGLNYNKRSVVSLTDEEIYALAEVIKKWEFIPSGVSSFDNAQVTAGGILAKEIDKNMRSIKHKNLFITGEALDIDGLCGGYNLHWAFSSGIIAGNAAADDLKKR